MDFWDLFLEDVIGFLMTLAVSMVFGFIILVRAAEIWHDATADVQVDSDSDFKSTGLSDIVAFFTAVLVLFVFKTLNMVLILLRVEKSDRYAEFIFSLRCFSCWLFEFSTGSIRKICRIFSLFVRISFGIVKSAKIGQWSEPWRFGKISALLQQMDKFGEARI